MCSFDLGLLTGDPGGTLRLPSSCVNDSVLRDERQSANPATAHYYRNVWSATELQAKNEKDSWSAPTYSAFGCFCPPRSDSVR
jgi:hypothetical protein